MAQNEQNLSRRDFLLTAGVIAAGTMIGGGKALAEQAAMLGTSDAASAFQLPPLPYAQDALEPYVSARTMSFHYGKYHKEYVDNLNKLIDGTPRAGKQLEQE